MTVAAAVVVVMVMVASVETTDPRDRQPLGYTGFEKHWRGYSIKTAHAPFGLMK